MGQSLNLKKGLQDDSMERGPLQILLFLLDYSFKFLAAEVYFCFRHFTAFSLNLVYKTLSVVSQVLQFHNFTCMVFIFSALYLHSFHNVVLEFYNSKV